MKLKINWSAPVLDEDVVLKIAPNDLDDFYFSASDLDKGNLYFVLLTSFLHYEEREDKGKAAHLCFLIANYLFVAYTPPGSAQLALYYIRKAIELDPLPEYRQWLTLIRQGN